MGYSKTTLWEKLDWSIICLTILSINKDIQPPIDELWGKYVAFIDNAPSGYFIGGVELGKVWPKLKSLHASYTTLSEVFHDIKLLQKLTCFGNLGYEEGWHTYKE